MSNIGLSAVSLLSGQQMDSLLTTSMHAPQYVSRRRTRPASPGPIAPVGCVQTPIYQGFRGAGQPSPDSPRFSSLGTSIRTGGGLSPSMPNAARISRASLRPRIEAWLTSRRLP